MRKKVTCQCVNCGRPFEALSSRAKWCPREECQNAKLAYQKEKQHDYNKDWYDKNVVPKARKKESEQIPYKYEGIAQHCGQRDINAHSDSNWTYYSTGSCTECHQKSRLNRFKLCSDCYSRINDLCNLQTYKAVGTHF